MRQRKPPVFSVRSRQPGVIRDTLGSAPPSHVSVGSCPTFPRKASTQPTVPPSRRTRMEPSSAAGPNDTTEQKSTAAFLPRLYLLAKSVAFLKQVALNWDLHGVPVAAAIQRNCTMRRLVRNLIAGLGLATLVDAVHFLSSRTLYRTSRTPLAGPRPGSWLPG
jgi:hypothetical protein